MKRLLCLCAVLTFLAAHLGAQESRATIQGTVKDDQGVPVEGAALHIGRQLAYSDSSGHFMARFSKRATFLMSVAPEEFINNGVYEVVSAPPQVTADREENARDVQVVVRRVLARQAQPTIPQNIQR